MDQRQDHSSRRGGRRQDVSSIASTYTLHPQLIKQGVKDWANGVRKYAPVAANNYMFIAPTGGYRTEQGGQSTPTHQSPFERLAELPPSQTQGGHLSSPRNIIEELVSMFYLAGGDSKHIRSLVDVQSHSGLLGYNLLDGAGLSNVQQVCLVDVNAKALDQGIRDFRNYGPRGRHVITLRADTWLNPTQGFPPEADLSVQHPQWDPSDTDGRLLISTLLYQAFSLAPRGVGLFVCPKHLFQTVLSALQEHAAVVGQVQFKHTSMATGRMTKDGRPQVVNVTIMGWKTTGVHVGSIIRKDWSHHKGNSQSDSGKLDSSFRQPQEQDRNRNRSKRSSSKGKTLRPSSKKRNQRGAVEVSRPRQRPGLMGMEFLVSTFGLGENDGYIPYRRRPLKEQRRDSSDRSSSRDSQKSSQMQRDDSSNRSSLSEEPGIRDESTQIQRYIGPIQEEDLVFRSTTADEGLHQPLDVQPLVQTFRDAFESINQLSTQAASQGVQSVYEQMKVQFCQLRDGIDRHYDFPRNLPGQGNHLSGLENEPNLFSQNVLDRPCPGVDPQQEVIISLQDDITQLEQERKELRERVATNGELLEEATKQAEVDQSTIRQLTEQLNQCKEGKNKVPEQSSVDQPKSPFRDSASQEEINRLKAQIKAQESLEEVKNEYSQTLKQQLEVQERELTKQNENSGPESSRNALLISRLEENKRAHEETLKTTESTYLQKFKNLTSQIVNLNFLNLQKGNDDSQGKQQTHESTKEQQQIQTNTQTESLVQKPSDQDFSDKELVKANEDHPNHLKNKISELQREALQTAKTVEKNNLSFAAEFKTLRNKVIQQKEIIKNMRIIHRKQLEAAKKNNSADAALERKMKITQPQNPECTWENIHIQVDPEVKVRLLIEWLEYLEAFVKDHIEEHPSFNQSSLNKSTHQVPSMEEKEKDQTSLITVDTKWGEQLRELVAQGAIIFPSEHLSSNETIQDLSPAELIEETIKWNKKALDYLWSCQEDREVEKSHELTGEFYKDFPLEKAQLVHKVLHDYRQIHKTVFPEEQRPLTPDRMKNLTSMVKVEINKRRGHPMDGVVHPVKYHLSDGLRDINFKRGSVVAKLEVVRNFTPDNLQDWADINCFWNSFSKITENQQGLSLSDFQAQLLRGRNNETFWFTRAARSGVSLLFVLEGIKRGHLRDLEEHQKNKLSVCYRQLLQFPPPQTHPPVNETQGLRMSMHYLQRLPHREVWKILVCCYLDSQEAGARLMYNVIRLVYEQTNSFDYETLVLCFKELDQVRKNIILCKELSLLSEQDALCWFSMRVKSKHDREAKIYPKRRFMASDICRIEKITSYLPGEHLPPTNVTRYGEEVAIITSQPFSQVHHWRVLQGYSQDGVIRFNPADSWDPQGRISSALEADRWKSLPKSPNVFDYIDDENVKKVVDLITCRREWNKIITVADARAQERVTVQGKVAEDSSQDEDSPHQEIDSDVNDSNVAAEQDSGIGGYPIDRPALTLSQDSKEENSDNS